MYYTMKITHLTVTHPQTFTISNKKEEQKFNNHTSVLFYIVITELGELPSAGCNKQIVDSNYFLNFLRR